MHCAERVKRTIYLCDKLEFIQMIYFPHSI